MRKRAFWPLIVSLLVLATSLECSLVTRAFHNGELPAPTPAPPPDNAGQIDASTEFALEGTWVSDTDTGFGTTMHTELILEYDGTFSQQVTAGSLLTYDTGEYAVGDGFIHFVVHNHQPQEYNGQPLTWLTSFTYEYAFVDEDTLSFEDRVAGVAWLAYRQ